MTLCAHGQSGFWRHHQGSQPRVRARRVKIGEYVIVHVGFALSRLDENEAKKVFQYLREMDDLTELKEGGP